MNSGITAINAEVQQASQFLPPLLAEIGKVIVGQKYLVERLVIGLLANGHVLLEGVPGLAKTLAVKTLAACLDVKFARLQFTPDMLPADVVGTQIYVPGERKFAVRQGPIFAHLILADEINRAPAKVQSALLEAMQEKQVTIGDQSFKLEEPFLVLATQNPIEQEGTYPLPEAQQDRFMFKIYIGYPSYEEEYEIAMHTTGDESPKVEKILSAEDILTLQKLVRRVPAAPPVINHALDLVRRTRPSDAAAPEFVKRHVAWGAGPRAVQFLILGAKARAVLRGNYHVSTEDLRALAPAVLRHRVITNFAAQAEGYDSDRLIRDLLDKTQPHAGGLLADDRVNKAINA